MNGDTIKTHS